MTEVKGNVLLCQFNHVAITPDPERGTKEAMQVVSIFFHSACLTITKVETDSLACSLSSLALRMPLRDTMHQTIMYLKNFYIILTRTGKIQ